MNLLLRIALILFFSGSNLYLIAQNISVEEMMSKGDKAFLFQQKFSQFLNFEVRIHAALFFINDRFCCLRCSRARANLRSRSWMI